MVNIGQSLKILINMYVIFKHFIFYNMILFQENSKKLHLNKILKNVY